MERLITNIRTDLLEMTNEAKLEISVKLKTLLVMFKMILQTLINIFNFLNKMLGSGTETKRDQKVVFKEGA